jgi:hypothetical protein
MVNFENDVVISQAIFYINPSNYDQYFNIYVTLKGDKMFYNKKERESHIF